MEKKGIFLANRHISLLLAFFILASFFIFISGYFFGKKKTVEKFYSKVDQESLADHVYYSVCSNYNSCDDDQEQESTEETTGERASEDLVCKSLENEAKDLGTCVDSEDLSSCKGDESLLKQESNIKLPANQASALKNLGCENIQEKEASQKDLEGGQYYAELVGFGSRVAANAFCNKLNKQGIMVYLKTRRSRTSRGRNIDWYQAVTGKFDNKSDLVAFVDIIKDKENLKGIKIVHS